MNSWVGRGGHGSFPNKFGDAHIHQDTNLARRDWSELGSLPRSAELSLGVDSIMHGCGHGWSRSVGCAARQQTHDRNVTAVKMNHHDVGKGITIDRLIMLLELVRPTVAGSQAPNVEVNSSQSLRNNYTVATEMITIAIPTMQFVIKL
eukprot:2937250-Amphidinium_carterae.2